MITLHGAFIVTSFYQTKWLYGARILRVSYAQDVWNNCALFVSYLLHFCEYEKVQLQCTRHNLSTIFLLCIARYLRRLLCFAFNWPRLTVFRCCSLKYQQHKYHHILPFNLLVRKETRDPCMHWTLRKVVICLYPRVSQTTPIYTMEENSHHLSLIPFKSRRAVSFSPLTYFSCFTNVAEQGIIFNIGYTYDSIL